MGLFETVTGAVVKDCIVEDDCVTFVIKEGDMGLAIGKGGINVKKVEDAIGRKVDLLEFSRDPIQFTKNLLHPIKPKNAYVSQKSSGLRVLNLQLEPKDRKMICAKGKQRLEAIKFHLLRHHHAIDDIEVK